MRCSFEALWKFLIYSLKPIRYTEPFMGWVDIGMRILIIIGLIANTSIGIAIKWEYWPIITISLLALFFLVAGVRLQYKLLKAKFYLQYRGYSEKILALPPAPFLASLELELLISNQQKEPRSISNIILQIESKNGYKKEFSPRDSNDKPMTSLGSYLLPSQSKTISLRFVYDIQPKLNGERLYIADDLGAYTILPIYHETLIEMAKKSKSRSGGYQPL